MIHLRVTDIPQEFFQKDLRIKIIHAGAGKCLTIPRISLSLVPLGAVRGDLNVIALLTPQLILVEAVNQRVPTGESSRPFHIRIHCKGGQKPLPVRTSRQLHIAKTHVSKSGKIWPRLPSLIIDRFLLCLAQIGRVESPLRCQQFPVAQSDLGPIRQTAQIARINPDLPGKILSEIQNGHLLPGLIFPM